jgi:hypothetical protein
MKAKTALVCFLSTFLSAAAFGQFSSMSWRPEGDTMVVKLGEPWFNTAHVVSGAPYSGEWTNERVQTLADGTHITGTQQNNKKVWRDSQGRVRTEESLLVNGLAPAKGGQFVLVEINDPVAGFTYVLDDQNKSVHRFAITGPPAPRAVPPTPAPAAEKAQVHWSSEKLGTQNIEGLVAEGTRGTRTIPIGEIGNDGPLLITSESWFSRELKETVLSKNSDPRYGENLTRLTNISRAEPDAALFAPPTGFMVVDEKDSFSITLRKQ